MNPNILDLAEYGLMKLAEELEEEAAFDLSDLDDEELLALALGLDDDDLEKEAAISELTLGRIGELLKGTRTRATLKALRDADKNVRARLGYNIRAALERPWAVKKTKSTRKLLEPSKADIAEAKAILKARALAAGGAGVLGGGGYGLYRMGRRRR